MNNAIVYQCERLWSMAEMIFKKKIIFDSETAIISFTFDDAPISSFIRGGKILEEHGLRGTYYVSKNLFNQETSVGLIADYSTISEYHKRGHEIANHTFAHIDCTKTNSIGIINNIIKNRKLLNPFVSNNFSYPYGSVSLGARIIASLFTTSARSTLSGINRGCINLVHLNAVKIYHLIGIEGILDLISDCAKKGGWLIFYTHDIEEEPSNFGCTPNQFTKIVQAVIRKKIDVLTVQQAIEFFKSQNSKTKNIKTIKTDVMR